MSEQRYYIELTFPAHDLIEIMLKTRDEKALMQLVKETFHNYLNTPP